MKLFVKRLFLFFIPFAIIAYPLDLFLSSQVRHIKQFPGEHEVMKDIYDGRIQADIAIYGSSRAWVHVDPKILQDTLGKSAYNFGIDAHHFRLQYLRHLELFRLNKKPEMIIVSLDAFSLEMRKDLYGLEQYLPYMLWNENIREYTGSYKGYHWLDYNLPFVRYIGKKAVIQEVITHIFSTKTRPNIRESGYAGMDKTWNSDLEKAKSEMKSYKIKLHDKSVQLFHRFIKECKEQDIQLVFVCTPEYIEGQRFIENRTEIIEMYEQIARVNQIKFFDYSNDSMCLDRSLFYNSLHLNKTGAELFSAKFAGQLRKSL